MLPAVIYVVGVPLGLATFGLLIHCWPRPHTPSRRTWRWVVIIAGTIAVVAGWPYVVAAAVVTGGVVVGLRLTDWLSTPPPAQPGPLAIYPPRPPSGASPRAVADYWDQIARQEREQRLSDQHDWDDWRWGHRAAPPPGYWP